MAIKIGIESYDGEAAWASLEEIDGISVIRETVPAPIMRSMDAAAIVGMVVGITGTTIKIGELLAAWYQKRKTEDPRFDAVIELPDGSRLSLGNATPEELAKLLKSLPTDEGR